MTFYRGWCLYCGRGYRGDTAMNRLIRCMERHLAKKAPKRKKNGGSK